MSATKVPALNNGLGGIPPKLKPFLSAIIETLQVRARHKGNELDGAVTFRDLVNAGIATSSRYKGNGSVVGPAVVQDNAVPPSLEGFSASPGAASAVITWRNIVKPNHAYVEVWLGNSPSMEDAQLIGNSSGQIYVVTDLLAEQQYWFSARAVSDSGVVGEFTEPSRVIPYDDDRDIVSTVKDGGGHPVDGLPYLYVPPGGVEIDGTVLEEGTYFLSLFIANGSIVRAQIAKATINSANFKSISANKIIFNEASGKVLNAAVILGGLISGTRFEGSEMIGGVFNGTRITVGGEEIPAIDIRGSDGVVSINSPLKTPGQLDSFDAIEFSQGSIAEVIYIPEYGQAKSQVMSRLEHGVASSNVDVTLPGYWREVPKIIVAPSEVVMPDPASDTGGRRLECKATNIQRLSDDPQEKSYYQIKFTPTARVIGSGTSRNVNIASTVFEYEDYVRRPVGLNVLANAGQADSQTFIIPQTANSADITTGVEIYEWVDLDGDRYFFAAGSVVMQFFISNDNGATWDLIGQTGSFNSGGYPNLAHPAIGVKSVKHSFNFAASAVQRIGKVRYFVGAGQVYNSADTSNWNGGRVPYARIFIRCQSAMYPVAAGENYLNGKLDWLAISR